MRGETAKSSHLKARPGLKQNKVISVFEFCPSSYITVCDQLERDKHISRHMWVRYTPLMFCMGCVRLQTVKWMLTLQVWLPFKWPEIRSLPQRLSHFYVCPSADVSSYPFNFWMTACRIFVGLMARKGKTEGFASNTLMSMSLLGVQSFTKRWGFYFNKFPSTAKSLATKWKLPVYYCTQNNILILFIPPFLTYLPLRSSDNSRYFSG